MQLCWSPSNFVIQELLNILLTGINNTRFDFSCYFVDFLKSKMLVFFSFSFFSIQFQTFLPESKFEVF